MTLISKDSFIKKLEENLEKLIESGQWSGINSDCFTFTEPIHLNISKEVQNTFKIKKDFLENQGWKVIKEYPLFDEFEHTKNSSLKMFLDLYGGFGIAEYHWMNKDEVIKEFSTINPKLTEEDYFTIVRLLNLNI